MRAKRSHRAQTKKIRSEAKLGGHGVTFDNGPDLPLGSPPLPPKLLHKFAEAGPLPEVGRDWSGLNYTQPGPLTRRSETRARFARPTIAPNRRDRPCHLGPSPARELPIFDSVRLIRGFALPATEVFEVARIISAEKHHCAVALKRENVRRHPVEKPTVV